MTGSNRGMLIYKCESKNFNYKAIISNGSNMANTVIMYFGSITTAKNILGKRIGGYHIRRTY